MQVLPVVIEDEDIGLTFEGWKHACETGAMNLHVLWCPKLVILKQQALHKQGLYLNELSNSITSVELCPPKVLFLEPHERWFEWALLQISLAKKRLHGSWFHLNSVTVILLRRCMGTLSRREKVAMTQQRQSEWCTYMLGGSQGSPARTIS